MKEKKGNRLLGHSTQVSRTIFAISVATLTASASFIISTLKTTMPVGEVIAWTLTGVSVIVNICALGYLHVVSRINTLLTHMEELPSEARLQSMQTSVEEAVAGLRRTYGVISKELLQSAQPLGLERVYASRQEILPELCSLLKGAKKSAKFLGICLSMPLRIPQLERLLADQAKKGVSFQFAFLKRVSSPCDFYEQRTRDESYPVNLTKEPLRAMATANMQRLKSVHDSLDAESRGYLAAKEYQAFPYMFLIIIDEVLFVGSYLFGEQCPNSPVFKFRRVSEGSFEVYERHFDTLWSASSDALNVASTDIAIVTRQDGNRNLISAR